MQSYVKSINYLLCREWIRGGKRRRQKPKGGCGDPGQRWWWLELSRGIGEKWMEGKVGRTYW